ncbi:TPA: LysR substrate-binding domain-containing protein [Escherichia coli]
MISANRPIINLDLDLLRTFVAVADLNTFAAAAAAVCRTRDMVLATLNKADIPWRLAYVASTLPAVRAAVKAGLGVTARPVEMMSPDLRVLSGVDGLPPLPDTEYLLCYDPSSNNELAQVIYQAMESYHNPWQYSPMSAPEGDDSLLIERDIE